MRKTFGAFGSLLIAACLTGFTASLPADQPVPGLIRVGMAQTFFHDIPKPLVQLVTDPFGGIMRQTTGLDGRLIVGGDAFEIAQKVESNEYQLGVFHGFEFAWVQQKHHELKPLMIAVNAQHSVTAYVPVRKDSEVTSFCDLKGKDFSVPKRTKEHCRLFLERTCLDGGPCGSKAFFNQVVSSASVEVALDELCRGNLQAAIVDSIGLEFYKDLKPGCFARLKVLKQSDPFPQPVIAYRQGVLSDATLAKFRDGLLSAHRIERGRDMMKLWKINGFEAVPVNYAQGLADCLKNYPPPEVAKVSRR